jgi:hypothetical protein
MNQSPVSDNTVECLLESLIRMLGKSNQRVDELSKRIGQLELIILSQHKTEYAPRLISLKDR